MPLLLRISFLLVFSVLTQLAFAGAEGRQAGDSTVVTYHENGKVKETGAYKNGQKHGRWREYGENGIIVKETKYKKGEFRWERLYNEKGRLKQIRNRKGKIHKINECGC